MEPLYFTVKSTPKNWQENNTPNDIVSLAPWEHTALVIGKVKVTGRKSWGASLPFWKNEVIYYNTEKKSLRDYLTSVVIHHTDNNDDVRSNEAKHKARGYAALGYHFFINKEGIIFEGRPLETMGGHAGVGVKKGVLNDPDWGKIGIVLQGDYHIDDNWFEWLSETTFPEKQKESLVQLLEGVKQKYQVDKVLMHKEINRNGSKTVCPGDHLYETIENIRTNLFNKNKRKDDKNAN